jgi:hypothetical protein
MPFETCRHIKEDGAYCASPALRGRKYCYYHLAHRARRLRRAWALRYMEPCRLQIPQLDNLRSVQVALTEVVEALAAGQLDRRDAGLMLYALQQATTVTRLALQVQQTRGAQEEVDEKARVQEDPNLKQRFGIPPGTDLDAETEVALRVADEQAEVRRDIDYPGKPNQSGSKRKNGGAAKEEAYQVLRWQLHNAQQELRQYKEAETKARMKQEEEIRARKKEAASVPAPNTSVADTA